MNEINTQCSNEYIPHPNDPVSDEYMELKNEPVLYEWKIEVPMYGAWFMSISSGGVGLLIAGCFALFGEENSFVGSVLFSFLGVSLVLFVRYFGHPNEIFHYFITPKGVYYTQQGKVSDNFYLVINMLGWLLVLVSLVAVAVIGPFALVGAGGGAFMAMGMTKMRAKVSHLGAYFYEGPIEMRVYSKGYMFDTITKGSNEYFPHPNDSIIDEYLVLKKEPVLYEWKIEVQQYQSWLVSVVIGGGFLLLWIWTSFKDGAWFISPSSAFLFFRCGVCFFRPLLSTS